MAAVAGERVSTQTEHLRAEVGARVAVLALIYLLTTITGTGHDNPYSVLLLTLLAVAGALPVHNRMLRRWRPSVEELLAATIIASTQPLDVALLPYLVVPALSAGLIGGWTLAVITAGSAALVMLWHGVVVAGHQSTSAYVAEVSQWILLAVAVGLLGAWIRRVQGQRSSDARSYAEASRLLGQLREVSRELSGGLDSMSLAQAELQSLHLVCPYTRGCVFVRSPGGLLVLLATDAVSPVSWDPDLGTDSVWGATWRTGQAHRSDSGLTDEPSLHSMVLPLVLEGATVGLVGLERGAAPFDDEEVAAAMRVLAEGAARLDAALLFDDVRTFATTEERRRVAREIHDGIAQELASLGYAVDELTARADPGQPELARSLRDLRGELSRVITELRLSIFDLRTDVGPATSLTAVLADHARAVGAQSGLTVHLELAETPARLPIDTETQLLRIAQEAITNARKHADARNLWVTCRIDPPEALLRVSDDGKGVTPGRLDSYGFDIMKERTQRIGGRFEVAERPGGGTVVQVSAGQPAERGVDVDPRPARR